MKFQLLFLKSKGRKHKCCGVSQEKERKAYQVTICNQYRYFDYTQFCRAADCFFNFSTEITEHTIPYLFPRLTVTQHQFWPTAACFLAHTALSPRRRHPLVQCPVQKEKSEFSVRSRCFLDTKHKVKK